MNRVLVIEDHPDLASFMADMLASPTVDVDVAVDGIDGLARARRSAYDVVMLDLHLPGIGGVSLLQSILDAKPEQSIIVVSGQTDVGCRIRCLEAGAADFLAKPFTSAELVARMTARLRDQGRRSAPFDATPSSD